MVELSQGPAVDPEPSPTVVMPLLEEPGGEQPLPPTDVKLEPTPAQQLCLSCGLCCAGTLYPWARLDPTDSDEALAAIGLEPERVGDHRCFALPCRLHGGLAAPGTRAGGPWFATASSANCCSGWYRMGYPTRSRRSGLPSWPRRRWRPGRGSMLWQVSLGRFPSPCQMWPGTWPWPVVLSPSSRTRWNPSPRPCGRSTYSGRTMAARCIPNG